MTYDEYLYNFSGITIAEIDDNASYVYKSCKDQNKQGVYFRVDILFKGKYSFHIDNTPRRAIRKDKEHLYYYPITSLKLKRIDEDTNVTMPMIQSNGRSLYQSWELEPGVYVAWAKIDFDESLEKKFDVNLGIYGEYFSLIDKAKVKEITEFNKMS